MFVNDSIKKSEEQPAGEISDRIAVETSFKTTGTPVITKILYWLIIVCCISKIALTILCHFCIESILDDAFMFTRYADNMIDYGKLSWNPGGLPTYGATSILYIFFIIPIRLIIPGNTGLVASLSSILSGILFIVFMLLILTKYTGADRRLRRAFVLFFFFSIAYPFGLEADHFASGMDTCFTLSYLALFILLAKQYEKKPSATAAVILGTVGGLAFFARPDLLIYTYIAPLSIAFFSADRKDKRNALIAFSVTVLVTAAQICIAYWYFNSPLPLSFYIKGVKYYGEHIYEIYKYKPVSQLVIYIISYWLLFALIISSLIIGFRNWMTRTSGLDKGLLMATFIFIFYYLFFVLQIMYNGQRFYYPTLPALIYLAAKSAVIIIDKVKESLRPKDIEFPKSLAPLLMACFMGIIALPIFMVIQDVRKGFTQKIIGHYKIDKNYSYMKWYALPEFSALPDDLVMATTEIGLVSMLNPRKQVIDMAGLNETYFAHNGFSADLLFHKYNPDLIYMPHPHYREMKRQIIENPYFQQHYIYFTGDQLHYILGVSLRTDSKYYQAMQNIINKAFSN